MAFKIELSFSGFLSSNGDIVTRPPCLVRCIFTILFAFTKSKVGHIKCDLK